MGYYSFLFGFQGAVLASLVSYVLTKRLAAATRKDTQESCARDPVNLSLGRVLELFSEGK